MLGNFPPGFLISSSQHTSRTSTIIPVFVDGHLQPSKGQWLFKLMTLFWGDLKSKLHTFSMKSKAEPQRYLHENVKMLSWAVVKLCLLEKNMNIYLNVKLLDGRNHALSEINFLKLKDPQIKLLEKTSVDGKGGLRNIPEAVIIFSQNEGMIFSYNLLHVADKENLLQTPDSQFHHQGWVARALGFSHNLRSYLFCSFKGAWIDLNWLSSAFRPDTQAVPEQDTGKAPPPELQGFLSFSGITRKEEEEPSQVSASSWGSLYLLLLGWVFPTILAMINCGHLF